MKIVVGGYIVGFPVGGMTWHHLNYLLGLVSLGHDVTYLEDGANHPPIDPSNDTTGDPTYGIAYLRRTFAAYGLNIPWHYRYGTIAQGLSIEEMQAALREADLFIAVSGVTPIDWYDLPKRTLVIDTDPVFTQLRMRDNEVTRNYYKRFTSVATFGRLIGTPASPLPTLGFDWIPTNQPISLPHWPATPVPMDGLFSTVGKWEHERGRTVEFNGQHFASSKGVEYDRLINLPREAKVPIEMRMAGLAGDEADRFTSCGWQLGSAFDATRSCESFADYIRGTRGEFTVAKQLYAGLPSGWFSDRSACFLASGRPVVTQASGFDQWLPTGDGLFSFTTQQEAVSAIETITQNPRRHGHAARAIAQRYFDSNAVLGDLLARAS
jgi:hypothetical protein